MFLIEAKKFKLFVLLGVPQSALRGGKIFGILFFIEASAIKSWEKSRSLGMGCLNNF